MYCFGVKWQAPTALTAPESQETSVEASQFHHHQQEQDYTRLGLSAHVSTGNHSKPKHSPACSRAVEVLKTVCMVLRMLRDYTPALV